MRSRRGPGHSLLTPLTIVGALALLPFLQHTAHAQAALEEEETTTVKAPTLAPEEAKENEAHFGVAFQLRNNIIPQGEFGFFVQRAPFGMSDIGGDIQLIRRKGNFEFQLGLGIDSLFVGEGLWEKKNQPPPTNEVSDVKFNGFGWYSVEFNFVNHTPFNKYIALRYGAGLGLAIFKGNVSHTDYRCSSSDLMTCTTEDPNAVNKLYSIPSVFPLIDVLIGLQFRLGDNAFINIDGGIHTTEYWSGTFGYYF